MHTNPVDDDSMMQSEDLISLHETLQQYLEGGDVHRLRTLTQVKPQNPNDVKKAISIATSKAGISKASAMLKLRDGLEMSATSDDTGKKEEKEKGKRWRIRRRIGRRTRLRLRRRRRRRKKKGKGGELEEELEEEQD